MKTTLARNEVRDRITSLQDLIVEYELTDETIDQIIGVLYKLVAITSYIDNLHLRSGGAPTIARDLKTILERFANRYKDAQTQSPFDVFLPPWEAHLGAIEEAIESLQPGNHTKPRKATFVRNTVLELRKVLEENTHPIDSSKLHEIIVNLFEVTYPLGKDSVGKYLNG